MVRWKETITNLRNFWREYKRYKIGLLGIGLLGFLIGMAVGAPFITSTEAYNRWDDVTYWENYPKGVAPEWVNLFSAKKSATNYAMTKPERVGKNMTFKYDYQFDVSPSDIVIEISPNKSSSDTTWQDVISLHIIRPDGVVFESLVKTEFHGDFSISFVDDPKYAPTIRNELILFAKKYESQENMEKVKEIEQFINPLTILFSKKETGIILGEAPPLKGQYKLITEFVNFNVPIDAETVILGSVFGVLGTDNHGRDLLVGIVWGSRLALLIGLITAVLSESVGIMYGVVSAYAGGAIDESMQRIMEIISSLPFLPILIILSYLIKPTLWNLALLMTIFFWTGPVKTVRSMALQIKEQPYIEASKALGASGWRIVIKHIVPQIMPYFFALLALAVPGAILTEAGISFLMGTAGISEPTWGRILHDAQRYMATISGKWWWVLSPGFFISLAGLTFVLIGSALDRILNPKLKR